MIIDAHAHVFAFPKLKNPPAMTPFMSAEQQIELMDTKGIDKAVILPLNSPEAPGEKQSIGDILSICEKYPGRFIPFCNIDPRLAKMPEKTRADDFFTLLNQYKELGCKGLGELVAKVYFDDPRLLLLFEACEQIGFPITFHTTIPGINSYGLIDDLGLPRFEKALKKFPRLKFFGHSQAFWNEISGDVNLEEKNGFPSGPVKAGGTLKRLFREYPNLYGDLSARSGFNALNRDPAHAYEFIEEFEDRLIFGLDYCSVKNDMRHIEWLTAARDAGNISEQAYEKIMWRNIDKLLQLGPGK